MKKITLLGDSIRLLGYGNKTAELLSEDFEVYQPRDNCRFAIYTLRGMFDWEEGMRDSRVIHWNNGLWDICDLFGEGAFTEKKLYVQTMVKIAEILKKRAKAVMFATTTPVRDGTPHFNNDIIREYNEAVVPELLKRRILINDLYSLVNTDRERYISEDGVHLSKEGINVTANDIAKKLKLLDTIL